MIAHLAASTLVALAAVAASMALRGRNGAFRHALLFAALLRFAAPTPWLAAVGSKLAPYAHTRVAALDTADRIAGLLLFGDPHLGSAQNQTASHAGGSVDVYIFLWAAGFGLCFAIWLRGLFRKIPGIREATLAEREALNQAQRTLSAKVGPGLRIATPRQAPGVRGIWRATIILPDGLSEDLTPAELEAVLVHELAHVSRRDNLLAAAAHLVACVFWFYPVTWWLERRMLREREIACDDMVLARGTNAVEYLSGLVKVCRMSFAGAAGYAGANGSNFQSRMERIMRVDFQRSSATIWRAGAAAVVAAAVMVPVAGAFLKAQETAPAPQVAIVLTPVESRIQAGKAMLQAGNFAGAEEAFRMAHELDPSNSEALMGLVEALIAEGRSERALVLLKRESAQSPGRLDLHLALGNTAVRAGQYDLAQSEFQTMLDRLDPASAAAGDIRMRMGETYRRMGNMGGAILQLQLAKGLLPGRLDVVSTLALCFDSNGQWKEAQKAYMEVIAIDPNNAVALNNAAYLLSQHGGDPDVALTYAKRAVLLKPESPEVSDTLGALYLERGMTDAALDIFRRILKQSPGSAEHMALRLVKNGQRDAVWADLTAALANHHSNQDDQAIVQIMQKVR